MLHLTGKNVILTRGKNILRGNALVYNLETGHSILSTGDSKGNSSKGNQRVRGVFVPNQEESGAKEKGKNPSSDKTHDTPASDATP